ncbi:hypothetical protein ACWGOQ_0012655 [Aquimarina sp. M1]
MKNQTHSIEEAINQIRSAGEKKNIAAFEEVSDSLLAIWENEETNHHAIVLLEICNNLSSYDFHPREKRMELLEQYAAKALFHPKLSLEIKQQMAFQHHLYYAKKQSNWERSPQFETERERLTQQWLKTLNQIHSEIDYNFNFSDVPDDNIQPPLETGLSAGIDPKHIKDSLFRKEYELEIEKNRQKTEMYQQQMLLHQLFKDYPSKIEDYILDVYSNNQKDLEALHQLFTLNSVEKYFQEKIMAVLKSKN